MCVFALFCLFLFGSSAQKSRGVSRVIYGDDGRLDTVSNK